MQTWLWVALAGMSVFTLGIVYSTTKKAKQKPRNLLLTLTVIVISLLIWVFVKPDMPSKNSSSITVSQSTQDYIKELQESLRINPNQSDAWFNLGNVYLAKGEFKSALTSFDYAIRLSSEVSANQLAAKATALYYLQSQRMGDEATQLLDESLTLDEFNETALMLIASDHFISFRYQEAIAAWTQILDSNRQGIDRIKLISSINQAKSMLP